MYKAKWYEVSAINLKAPNKMKCIIRDIKHSFGLQIRTQNVRIWEGKNIYQIMPFYTKMAVQLSEVVTQTHTALPEQALGLIPKCPLVLSQTMVFGLVTC